MSYQDIYQGGWFNWSHEAGFANTLTLSSHSGYFLVSFLSLLVSVAGTRFWVVVAFLIHQQRAGHNKHDGMHFQQQTILRNSNTPTSAVLGFAKVAWRWRKIARKPILRSLPVLVIALLSIGTFSAASILTADVTKATGNETLIRGDNCKWWKQDSTSALQQGGFRQKLAADAIAAASYSRACYEAGSGVSSQCGTYAAKSITWNGTMSEPCPFSPEICFSSPSAVFQMNTGPIDSHYILGLNAHKDDRVTYRRLTTCAPINATTFLSKATDSVGNINFNYSLGTINYLSIPNLTYTYNSRVLSDRIGYQIAAYSTDEGAIWSSQITKIQADITIFFLVANSLSYEGPNDDLIFAANKPINLIQLGKEKTYYQPDNLVNVLGCADQHQICPLKVYPGGPQCSDLGGTSLLSTKIPTGFNARQYATTVQIYRAIWLSNMFHLVDTRGASAIRAGESVVELYSASLSNTQWITEVSNWFSAALAKVQYSLVDMAVGPANYPNINYTEPPSYAKYLCHEQVVRSGGQYQNFSVLGIAIIVVFSTFFIWLSFVLDKATGWVQQWLHKGEDRRLQWLLDEKLQLQRMAYAGANVGRWEGHSESVPVTQSGDIIDMSLYLPANRDALESYQRLEREKQNPQVRAEEVQSEAQGTLTLPGTVDPAKG